MNPLEEYGWLILFAVVAVLAISFCGLVGYSIYNATQIESPVERGLFYIAMSIALHGWINAENK